jgi:hypothetical protein
MSDEEITVDYCADNLWLEGSPETVARLPLCQSADEQRLATAANS